MKEKVQYFGYGANSHGGVMAAITGNRNLVRRPATLKGFTLCVQRLDQVPDSVLPTSPVSISPQALLRESWPDSFETYIIRPGSKSDEVTGIIWELTPEERALVREWELIDFGWYGDTKGTAATPDGEEIDVETEGLREGQEVDRCVDGNNYDPFLNRLGDFLRVAQKARDEYYARQ